MPTCGDLQTSLSGLARLDFWKPLLCQLVIAKVGFGFGLKSSLPRFCLLGGFLSGVISRFCHCSQETWFSNSRTRQTIRGTAAKGTEVMPLIRLLGQGSNPKP